MKVYGELRIVGPHLVLLTLADDLEKKPSHGWHRDRGAELPDAAGDVGRIFCFVCSEEGERPACSLWIALGDDQALYVSNIVPKILRELSYDQYNTVLEDFCEHMVVPISEIKGVRAAVDFPDQQPEDWVSANAAALLRKFSLAANKSTGSAHPYDQERWFAFLVTAHREKAQLATDLLRRWLIEEEHWSGERAETLVVRYGTGRALLKYYDEHPA